MADEASLNRVDQSVDGVLSAARAGARNDVEAGATLLVAVAMWARDQESPSNAIGGAIAALRHYLLEMRGGDISVAVGMELMAVSRFSADDEEAFRRLLAAAMVLAGNSVERLRVAADAIAGKLGGQR